MKNTLFVLLDGMEDDPNPALNGKKPYEVAEMPFMYSKADLKLTTTGRGYTQLFLNEFFTGHPPETSRAALEAQGLGLNMKNNRMAFRLSPARIEGDTVCWSYEGDRYEKDLVEHISRHLNLLKGSNPEIKFFTNGRAVLTMDYDHELPDLKSPPRNSPYYDIPGPLGDLIWDVQNEIGITDYPWGCGRLGKQFPPYIKQMTAVSSSPTALGVAASLGYEIKMHRDIEPRLPEAVDALEKGNVFLHFDEVDEYSHEKDHMKKIKVLEKIDDLMERYFSDTERIVYFVDHGTSCVSGEHILMNVPLWTNIRTPMKAGEVSVLKDIIPTIMRN
jgi:2,3-bisphosphoglycerate-independent phosphoglycerate mutase